MKLAGFFDAFPWPKMILAGMTFILLFAACYYMRETHVLVRKDVALLAAFTTAMAPLFDLIKWGIGLGLGGYATYTGVKRYTTDAEVIRAEADARRAEGGQA